METSLSQSVLRTLALFSAQDQAPTLLELRRLLLKTADLQNLPSLTELQQILETGLADKVVCRNGLLFLRGHSVCEEGKVARYLRASLLLKKAYRWARGLRYLPFVRGVAVSGSLAQINARSSSDIDLFIIAAPRRIFLARFLVSTYFQILGLRRHGGKITGRFCLNHYVTESAALKQDHTVYTALLYTSFMPIIGRDHIERFWKNNLSWIREYIIAPSLPENRMFEFADRPRSLLQKFFEILLSPTAAILEKIAGWLQKSRIHQSQFVIVSGSELAFHPDSKGQRILGRYEQILQKVGI